MAEPKPEQKIVWTVLPAGVDYVKQGSQARQRMRLSIVVSPRLTPGSGGTTLKDFADQGFPDFLNWPETLKTISFKLICDGVTTDDQPLEVLTDPKPDPDWWTRVFPSDTPATSFRFVHVGQKTMHSFTMRNILDFARRHHAAFAAETQGRLPTLAGLTTTSPASPALHGMLQELDAYPSQSKPEVARFIDNLLGPKEQRVQAFGAIENFPAGRRATGAKPLLRALPADFAGLDPDLQVSFKKGVVNQGAAQCLYDFLQAHSFHNRPKMARKTGPATGPASQRYDFHRKIAALGDFPQILRKLGLVIDVALPVSNPLAQALAALADSRPKRVEGTIQLQIRRQSPKAARLDLTPLTGYGLTQDIRSQKRFFTKPNPAQIGDKINDEMSDGLLALGTAKNFPFTVSTVDADGAALKTLNMVATVSKLVVPAGGSVRLPKEASAPLGPPALRSAGIAVSQHGRAERTQALAGSSSANNGLLAGGNGGDVTLYAQDVLRGYRVDVFDVGANVWRSLCERDGHYRVNSAAGRAALSHEARDEGFVKGASATSTPGDDENLYLHETLFRWTGWSLCVKRPGRTVRALELDGGRQIEEVVDEVHDEAAGGTGIAHTYTVPPGTLPRLRFGRKYRLRARIVDLAGYSLPADDPSFGPLEQASEEVAYGRFDPVDPPALVPTHKLAEGESVERMVIRSNWNTGAHGYLTQKPFVDAVGQSWREYPEFCNRHVIPPKTSQLMAETHGLFDDAMGGATPTIVSDKYRIAERESGTLFDAAGAELVTPPGTANPATLPLRPPSPANPTGDRLAAGQYLILRDGDGLAPVETPYLSDPIVGGVALRGIPGVDKEGFLEGPPKPLPFPRPKVWKAPTGELVLLVPYDQDWPATRGLCIRIAEWKPEADWKPKVGEPDLCHANLVGDRKPAWDMTNRVLTIFLRKGEIAHVLYSSCVRNEVGNSYLSHLGLPSWASKPEDRKFITDMSALGCHRTVTPCRELTLVHATQQPVCVPEIKSLSADAPVLGATYADLKGEVLLHGPSTAKIEILAEWGEWVDDPSAPAPKWVKGQAQLPETRLPENFANSFQLTDERLAIRPAADAIPTPRFPGARHEFGDTRFRVVRYRIRATTRFLEYLPRELADIPANITREGKRVEISPAVDPGAPVSDTASVPDVIVQNSAPPSVPRVLYVIPTFRWERSEFRIEPRTGGAIASSTRHGNGLRVYLDRPWFSSGDGELLGVVLDSSNADLAQILDARKPYVTQWGLDPLFAAASPSAKMTPAAFPLAISRSGETVTLQEEAKAGGQVCVVGHRVRWDESRKLWYCDIEINPGPGTYFPFVRLALVRYQPNSISNARISRVALADFAQLAPQRAATLALDKDQKVLHVTLTGGMPAPTPVRGSMAAESPYLGQKPTASQDQGRNRIEVVLQSRAANSDSDLDWEDVPAIEPSLVATTKAIWEGTFDVSGVTLPGAKPPRAGARPVLPRTPAYQVAIREYERYYSDETKEETVAGNKLIRRVVKERLVYAETVALGRT